MPDNIVGGDLVNKFTDHHNIFLTYRSRSEKGIADDQYSQALETELEDNVTKALVNVLEYARGPVLARFLGLCGLKPGGPLEDIKFALHEGSSISNFPGKKPYLLEIVPEKEELKKSERVIARTTAPIHDARITAKHNVCFIEVKIRGVVTKPQRKSYLNKYGIDEADVITLTWEQIYAAFDKLIPRDEGMSDFFLSTGGFLLVQFLEFLEMLGLSAFSGIRHDHFEILEKEFEDITTDERAKLKWLQNSYAKAMKDGIDAKGNRHLSKATTYIHSGNITKQEVIPWISLSEEEPSRKTQFPHYGSSLEPELARVYVSCEGKNAYSKFLNACKTAPAEIALTLSNLRGYQIRVLRRVQIQVQRFKYDYDNPLMIIKCPLKARDLANLAGKWDEWFGSKEYYPGVFLEKEFEKDMVIDLSTRFISEVVETFIAMRPYRDLIHEWHMNKG